MVKFWVRSLVVIFLMVNVQGFSQDALSIVKKADEKMRGVTAKMEMTINTIRPTWKRSMQIKVWSKGSDFSMVLITSPAKDKGVSFLKRKKEVWNWYPTLERVIKLPPSMMNQSWMGTDFTNDDLVKESSVIHDYTHKLIGDTIIGSRSCYTIEMTPKQGSAVVWGKVISCIDKKDYIELHMRLYDEDGVLINIMNGYDPKLIGGRVIPSRFEMIPVDKKGHKTEMIYNNIVFDQPINDDFFNLNTMKLLK
ncbi:MAG: outer membrane lipoprotein-sorting protein [Saprospiraceae bacterium]|nr:outer membrane lipoprotein-sorting protein [Saprospiraceae bacterium]